jgi:PTH2 family peptidyl-tRNA hydrolase
MDSLFWGLYDMNFRHKQIVILRNDLTMSVGKTVVQACHAAVSGSEEARKKFPEWWRAWIKEGQCKIALKVESKEELLKLEEEAEALNLPLKLVRDMGLTEVAPETITCLAIGPAPSVLIDKITGRLPTL